MNSHNFKSTSSVNSNPRTIVSGRLKRPSKELPGLTSSIKKPFLKQYSAAMQEKLVSLKQKINEKKKEKAKEQIKQFNGVNSSKIQNFLKTKKPKQQKNLQDKIVKEQFHEFLQKNNLLNYKNLLFQNQIDTLEILEEATQKQLEQIGIPKGHCLKLKVNVAKWNQKNQKQSLKPRDNRTKDTERNKSFVSQVSKDKNLTQEKESPKKQGQSICIGTDQDGIESITFISGNHTMQKLSTTRNKFCLFCYKSFRRQSNQNSVDFCSQDCEDRYNQMFKKYETNLVKAEQEFKKDNNFNLSNQEEVQKDQQNDLSQNEYDILDQKNQFQDFDYQSYEQLRKELGDI